MTVNEAIAARRSVRKYKEEPVSRAAVERIVRAGMLAPSGKNRQPWEFTVLSGAAKDEMVEVMRAGIERRRSDPTPGSEDKLPGALHSCNIMASAPVLIAVVNPEEKMLHIPTQVSEHLNQLANAQSVGAAIENMCLAAVGEGLGSLWICDIFYAYEELHRWLGTDRRMNAVLALGVPVKQSPPRPRKSMEECVTWRWDAAE